MIGGTLTVVIHDFGVAAVSMLEFLNKRLYNYVLNKFYFRHNGAMGEAI